MIGKSKHPADLAYKTHSALYEELYLIAPGWADTLSKS